MTPRLLAIRVGVVMAALVLFFAGVWDDRPYLRWAGIALMFVGLALRFAGKKTPKA